MNASKAARAPRRGLGKLAVLRLGFGAMLAVLLLSALEAYRIQERASRQASAIYHRFVAQGEMLARVRRQLFLGSIYTRDFFLSEQPDRVAVFRKQMEAVKTDSDLALSELERATGKAELTELRQNVHEFWETLESTQAWSDEVRRSRAFAFVQSVIVPRRNAAGEMIRDLAEVNQSALMHSEAEFAHSRSTAMLRLSAILGLSVLLGLVVARISLSHAARLERESLLRFEEVIQAKKDLEQLSARLLEIQEDERRRLSRELHDEIGQALTALRIEISHAQTGLNGTAAVRERLDQARAMAERTLRTVRNISLLLRPSLLDDLGLGAALQWQAEEFGRRSGIACSVSEEGLDEDLPDPYKTCAYRIVQESLNNCEKHAGATQVRISVRQTAQELAVRIEDNGRGFVVDRSGFPAGRAGLGMLGMRERVAALGGELIIDSAEGRGTRIAASLPLGARTPPAARPPVAS